MEVEPAYLLLSRSTCQAMVICLVADELHGRRDTGYDGDHLPDHLEAVFGEADDQPRMGQPEQHRGRPEGGSANQHDGSERCSYCRHPANACRHQAGDRQSDQPHQQRWQIERTHGESSIDALPPLFIADPTLDADVYARELVTLFDRATRKE